MARELLLEQALKGSIACGHTDRLGGGMALFVWLPPKDGLCMHFFITLTEHKRRTYIKVGEGVY